MAVAVEAEVGHVVGARPLRAQGCRAGEEAVVVEEELVLAVAVVDDRRLGEEAEHRPILGVGVGDVGVAGGVEGHLALPGADALAAVEVLLALPQIAVGEADVVVLRAAHVGSILAARGR